MIWPLYETHEHALDALKEILGGNASLLEKMKVDQKYKDELVKILKEKFVESLTTKDFYEVDTYIHKIKKDFIISKDKTTTNNEV